MKRLLMLFSIVTVFAASVGSANALPFRHQNTESSWHRYNRFYGQRDRQQVREDQDTTADLDVVVHGRYDDHGWCEVGEFADCIMSSAYVGECRGGVAQCDTDGEYGTCYAFPSVEVCGDSRDNDCDGEIDEGCQCTPGSTMSCAIGLPGACKYGEMLCIGTGTHWGDCEMKYVPGFESPNEVDDDCNGIVDDVGDE